MDGILNLLMTVGPIAWGLVVKYHPAWKGVPNAIIPYATALVALLTKILAPEAAHAADFQVFGLANIPVAALALPAWLSWTAPVLSAGWQAIQNAMIYEVFLRGPAGAVLPRP